MSSQLKIESFFSYIIRKLIDMMMRIMDRHIYHNDHLDKNDVRHYKEEENIIFKFKYLFRSNRLTTQIQINFMI